MKTVKTKTTTAKKRSPKLVVNVPREGSYTSTFHHSDGSKTVKTAAPQEAAKPKPKFEAYDQGSDLGWYLRTVAKHSPDEELADILMDVSDWPAILEAMMEDHGENVTLSAFDLE